MPNPHNCLPWHDRLACPRCKSPLHPAASEFRCANVSCAEAFPTSGDVPILINEERSLFRINDFLERRITTFSVSDPSGPSKKPSLLRRLIPSNSRSVQGGRDRRFISEYQQADQWLLVIGLGDVSYTREGDANIIYSDVHFGNSVDLIADGHDIPFQSESFDAVLVISVMEHVVDPERCAQEVARVLKPGGRVLAATPFMQQVHLGRYDFTRFTQLGHRRLWRHFREIDSGISCGPGMALAWAWQYFLLSFSESQTMRKYLRAFAKFTSFPLPYFDDYLAKKKGAIDAASSFYFLGEKADSPIGDREIVEGYRGLDNL